MLRSGRSALRRLASAHAAAAGEAASCGAVVPPVWSPARGGLSRAFCTAAQTPPPRSATGGPVSWLSLALVALTGGGIVAFYNHEKQQRVQALLARSAPKSAGKAAIGGAWHLVDQHGKPFSNADLKGKFALLYFGFTHCPDICPDELVKMAEAVDLLEKDTGKQVQPVFISIDPERDSVKQVRDYVKEFHPRLIGLTGSKEACSSAARAFRVYYHKTDDGPDYLVDHSIIMYLIDPAGEFVAFYGKNVAAPELAAQIAGQMKRWTPPAAA